MRAGRGKVYRPTEVTIVSILLNSDYDDVQDIADAVGCSPATIRKWDMENKFPCHVLEDLGFYITYGKHECNDQRIKRELSELRDQINQIFEAPNE